MHVRFPEGAAARYLFRPIATPYGGSGWQVSGHGASFFVTDATPGRVIDFQDGAAGLVRGNKQVSKGEAEETAQRVLRRMGLPSDAVFGEARYTERPKYAEGPNVPQASWNVVWERRTRQGARFDQDSAGVTINATTGEVCAAFLRWFSKGPANTRVAFTKAQAIVLAEAEAKKRTGPTNSPCTLSSKAELRVLTAWSRFSDRSRPPRTIWEITVARTWPEGFRATDMYYVDATEGKVLGDYHGSPERLPSTPGAPSQAYPGGRGRGPSSHGVSPEEVRAKAEKVLFVLRWTVMGGAALFLAVAALLHYRQRKGAPVP